MAAPTRTQWHIVGEEVAICNCAWGCPCQFNSLPTYGNCEGPGFVNIHKGHFGDVSLDGVRFVGTYHWPGPVHEGNGTMQLIIDEQATPEQRAAIVALHTGAHGGGYFVVYGSVTPNVLDPIYAPIEFNIDRVTREATFRVSGLIECSVEPIKNPSTGKEHVARIVLPNGFEFKEADMVNAVSWQAKLGDKTLAHENSYAQLNSIDWSNDN